MIPVEPLETPDLSQAILAVDGVAATFPAQSAATQVRELIQVALVSDQSPSDHIRVDVNDEAGTTVTARIATTVSTDTRAVARSVADVLLADRADPAARVVVQVARVI